MTVEEFNTLVETIRTSSNDPSIQGHLMELQQGFVEEQAKQAEGMAKLEMVSKQRDEYAKVNNQLWLERMSGNAGADEEDSAGGEGSEEDIPDKRTYEDLEDKFD